MSAIVTRQAHFDDTMTALNAVGSFMKMLANDEPGRDAAAEILWNHLQAAIVTLAND